MSHDSVDRLQREASELYLSGDFPGAVRAWRAVLRIDAANSDALEGVRMASALCEPGSLPEAFQPAPATGHEAAAVRGHDVRTPSTERDIDKTLDAFFELMPAVSAPGASTASTGGSAPKANRAAPVATTTSASVAQHGGARQDDGLDFGDLADVDSIPIATGGPAETLDPDAVEADSPEAEEGFGLATISEAEKRKAGEASSGPSPAAMELRRRVGALLREAKDKAETGDRDGALSVLGRLYILDEQNAEARVLEAELRDQAAKDLEAVDRWLTEGIEAYDAGRNAEAKDLLDRVLKTVPGHREAIDYLEAIADREAHAPPPVPKSIHPDEDLFAETDLLGGPVLQQGPPELMPDAMVETPDTTLQLSPTKAAGQELPADGAGDVFGEAEIPSSPEGISTPRGATRTEFKFKRSRAVPRWVIPAAGGALVLAAAAFMVPKLLGTFSSSDGEGAATARSAASPSETARGRTSVPETVPAREAPKARAGTSVPAALDSARRSMESRDYGAAVIAYNDALTIDPTNREAIAGLQRAGDLYKARKAVEEQVDRIRMAFDDGEYTSALRLIYRLPESLDRSQIDRWKANGWFNLGLVALRAGEASQAVGHFDEALAADRDPEIESWRAFAIRYRDLSKDSAYYARVEGASFRPLDH